MAKPYSTVFTMFVVLQILGAALLVASGFGWHPCDGFDAFKLGWGFLASSVAIAAIVPKTADWGWHNKTKGPV